MEPAGVGDAADAGGDAGGVKQACIHDLPHQALLCIFSHLSGRDFALASCALRDWQHLAVHEDGLWQGFLDAEFAVGDRAGPDGAQHATFRLAYRVWHSQFRPGLRPYVRRSYRAWRRVKAFAAQHFPEVLHSLQPGTSEHDVAAAGDTLGQPLPPALQAIYRLQDGQSLEFDRRMDSQHPPQELDATVFQGLFGGYAFYDHLVSTRMLPLRRAVMWTTRLSARLRPRLPSSVRHFLVVAASFNFAKLFVVDLHGGDVWVNTQRAFVRAVPQGAPGADADGVLRWFEEYARRLDSGKYEVAPLDQDLPLSRSICLFPLTAPEMAVEVTRGVQVRATSLYAPEVSRPGQDLMTYSVRFSLLPEDRQAAHWPATAGPFRPISSVQLMSRHWVIRNADGEQVDEVRGEAVIGKYPRLLPGEPEFVYQSCTHQREPSGSMEGDFRFVQGSLQRPTGPKWDVLCPRFMLEVPQYIF